MNTHTQHDNATLIEQYSAMYNNEIEEWDALLELEIMKRMTTHHDIEELLDTYAQTAEPYYRNELLNRMNTQ